MSTLCAEEEGLLREIVERPGEGWPRLVYADWLEDNGRGPGDAADARDIREGVTYRLTLPAAADLLRGAAGVLPGGCEVESCGGLVVGVRLPLADWVARGRALVKEFPLRRVELSDRRPVHESGDWSWHPDFNIPAAGCRVPRALLGRLEGHSPEHPLWRAYPTEKEAVDAMSAACLAWARDPAPLASG